MKNEVRVYIHSLFERLPLETIIREIKIAFRKGYLSNPERDHYYGIASKLSLEQLIIQYEEAFKLHNEFSDSLFEKVVRFSSMSSFEECCEEALLLLDIALENDARLCGFTTAVKESQERLYVELNETLHGVGLEEGETNVLFSPYSFSIFQFQWLQEIAEFFEGLDPGFKQKILEAKTTLGELESFSDFIRLKKLSDKYTYGDTLQCIEKIRISGRTVGNISKTISDQKELCRRVFIVTRERALCRINGTLKKEKFLKLLDIIQRFLYLDNYKEERGRFSIEGGLGDYALREFIARTLYSLGLIELENPMEIDQKELREKLFQFVRKIKEI